MQTSYGWDSPASRHLHACKDVSGDKCGWFVAENQEEMVLEIANHDLVLLGKNGIQCFIFLFSFFIFIQKRTIMQSNIAMIFGMLLRTLAKTNNGKSWISETNIFTCLFSDGAIYQWNNMYILPDFTWFCFHFYEWAI